MGSASARIGRDMVLRAADERAGDDALRAEMQKLFPQQAAGRRGER
jgi:hypothetical protein